MPWPTYYVWLMQEESWRPKVGETVLWHMTYQRHGLKSPSRRVQVFSIQPNGLVRIKLSSGLYRDVKAETIGRLDK